jgi:hypothetical protein
MARAGNDLTRFLGKLCGHQTSTRAALAVEEQSHGLPRNTQNAQHVSTGIDVLNFPEGAEPQSHGGKSVVRGLPRTQDAPRTCGSGCSEVPERQHPKPWT